MTRNVTAFLQLVWGGLGTAVLCAACLSNPAHAQTVLSCNAGAQAKLIAEPVALNLRLYANGNVMVAAVDDNREDASTALSLLVISPPRDAAGEPQCRRVSASVSDGYAAILVDKAKAAYDPATGLTVTFPALLIPSVDSWGDKIDLSVTINQATGEITPVHEGAPE